MIKKYATILMVLVIFSFVFIPGVMAQENEKASTKEIPVIKNGTKLSEEKENDLGQLIQALLDAYGIDAKIISSDNFLRAENENSITTSGNISFQIFDGKNYKTVDSQVFFTHDLKNNTVESMMKSEETYVENRMELNSTSNEVKFEFTRSIDGTLQIELQTFNISSIGIENLNRNAISASSGLDFPSDPPSGAIKITNDVNGADLLFAGSVVAFIASFMGLPELGILMFCMDAIDWINGKAGGPTASDMRIDIYSYFSTSKIYIAMPPACGYGAALTTIAPYSCLYLELDYLI